MTQTRTISPTPAVGMTTRTFDRRYGFARRGQRQHGRGRYPRYRRHTIGHRDADEHPGKPQTHGSDLVTFPRNLAVTPIKCEVWDPETGKYEPIYNEKREIRSTSCLRREQIELNFFLRRSEMSSERNPEAFRFEHPPGSPSLTSSDLRGWSGRSKASRCAAKV